MFQEKLIIIDSSWLPRKYTARTCVLRKYRQQIHLEIPATQGQGKQKKSSRSKCTKGTGRKQHKCRAEQESELHESCDRSVSSTDRSRRRWWRRGRHRREVTEVSRGEEEPGRGERTGIELQEGTRKNVGAGEEGGVPKEQTAFSMGD